MKHSYEITPRPAELGGGWRLRLFTGDKEAGGGVFPIEQEDPQEGVTWWNHLTEQDRAHWLSVAASAVPADAWTAYLSAEAHMDAETVAYEWLDAREHEDAEDTPGID